MRGAAPSRRSSPVLIVIVLVALAIGAAASLVAGAATAAGFHSGPDGELVVPVGVLEAAFLVAFGLVVGLILWVRLSSTSSVPGRMVVGALVVLLVGILFVVVLQAFSGAGGFGMSGGGNSTASGGNGSPPPPTNVTLGGPGGVLTPLHVPAWTVFVVVIGIALIVGGLAVPRLWGAWSARDRDGPSSRRATPAEVAEVRGALATAAQALATGTEPRDVIVALYATMLARVGPLVGGVDADTPEEIRSLHLVRLGIRASAAQTLTRLFEEARYSTHPMGSDASERATAAIAEALEDLDRAPRAP